MKSPHLLVLVLNLLVGTLCFGSDLAPVVDGESSEFLFHSINQLRKQAGLRILNPGSADQRAAEFHSLELMRRRVLSHSGADGSRVADRYRGEGGSGLRAGEIIGAADSPESLLEAWMHSESHREVILGPNWWTMGASAIRLENGRLVSVIVFSDSRWEEKSFIDTGTRYVLEAVLLHDERNRPIEVFVSIHGKKYSAEFVEELPGKGSLLRIALSLGEWIPPIPMEVYAGLYLDDEYIFRQTDLVLLK